VKETAIQEVEILSRMKPKIFLKEPNRRWRINKKVMLVEILVKI
jgi:hypothetical protein